MKIQANKVENFINNLNSDINGVLIYGPDLGLVTLRAQEIKKKILPDYKNSLALIELNSSILKDKPEVVANEFTSISMFSDKKLIIIDNPDNTLSKTLDLLFLKPSENKNFIIITADDLDSKSTLRKFAEYNDYFASLPCYKDDETTISQLIHKTFKDNGFKYSLDAVKYLIDNFGGDRMIILSELDKLMMYKYDEKAILLKDAKACVHDSSESDINEFVNNLASLNFEKSFKDLHNLQLDGIFPIVIIRSAISYFLKLQLFKYQLQNGLTFEEITTKEGIFWKQKPILLEHLKLLTSKNIDVILEILLEEECKMKGKIS